MEVRNVGTVRSEVLDMGWHVAGSGSRPGCEMSDVSSCMYI